MACLKPQASAPAAPAPGSPFSAADTEPQPHQGKPGAGWDDPEHPNSGGQDQGQATGARTQWVPLSAPLTGQQHLPDPPPLSSLTSASPATHPCLTETTSSVPQKGRQGEGEEPDCAPSPPGCILIAFDWAGYAFDPLLGPHREEGREESLIHQTEILIELHQLRG